MNPRRIDWHLTISAIGLVLAFVVAIPTLYNFEKRRFFWQADLPNQEITKNSDAIEF
ncbi:MULTISPECIES: hypothetical protein [unclassified Microcoleus]|uniref:hypothetical protein n=1 Tax=unclassified Microcoleus TaxID=2642155 RepID=UPI0025FD0399|nr:MULTISPECIES: hypothetical protein [unclassified Microcoleus]